MLDIHEILRKQEGFCFIRENVNQSLCQKKFPEIWIQTIEILSCFFGGNIKEKRTKYSFNVLAYREEIPAIAQHIKQRAT